MSTPALSVCVLACNEADLLERCLDSVAWADEIVVVVDARSSDASEDVARKRAARVEVRPYAGDVAQKRHCASLASHDWVMILDPDEVVPPDLAREIRGALDAADAAASPVAWEINRVTHHLGRWLRHGDFHPDWVLRLYRRSAGRWCGHDPHGRVEVEGQVARLRTELEHFSYRDFADQIERIQFFSDEAARSLHALGRRATLSDIVLRPPARFLRAYLLKRGFLDGLPGFVVASATAFHVLSKYVKLWELDRARQRGE